MEKREYVVEELTAYFCRRKHHTNENTHPLKDQESHSGHRNRDDLGRTEWFGV